MRLRLLAPCVILIAALSCLVIQTYILVRAEARPRAGECSSGGSPPDPKSLLPGSFEISDHRSEVVHATALPGASEVEGLVRRLPPDLPIDRLAEKVDEFSLLEVRPEDRDRVAELVQPLVHRLREKVRQEVISLRQKALLAPTYREGAALLLEAKRILALYPLGSDSTTRLEARQLSDGHQELVSRLEAIRRQRYCQWATGRIEAAFAGYHQHSSFLRPLAENQALVDSLVECLKEVDTAFLDQVTLDLFRSAVDQTKGSISERDIVVLTKRLTDPANKRMTLGDF